MKVDFSHRHQSKIESTGLQQALSSENGHGNHRFLKLHYKETV